MFNSPRSSRSDGKIIADRLIPDWILGAVMRAALVPGLWGWGRANAEAWPGVVPGLVSAADYWDVPLLPAPFLAQLAVWGAHFTAALLVAGFMTRIVGLTLFAASLAYMSWIGPENWASALVFSAVAFYLFVRGGGALSLDGSIAATTR